jgi:pimeloyl-ACP methyl ester carboxylesterase
MRKLLLPMLLAVLVVAPPASGAPHHASPSAAKSVVHPVHAPAHAPMHAKSGRVPVNGLEYYYEIHGTGKPLLLLHGGLGAMDMFGPVRTKLAETHLVISVDLQGHGRTELGTRQLRMQDMGDDMVALVHALGHDTLAVMGYSMGGEVALRMAIQHPHVVRRLVLVSTGFAKAGFYEEMLPQQAQVGAGMAEYLKPTPMYKEYVAVAPKPEDFPKLLEQMGAWMREPYDWSADVAKLPMPVMLVYGDSDMYRPEHEVEFFHLLGGGLKDAGWSREHQTRHRLAILPDRTHYDIFFAPELATTVLPFLNGVSHAKTWEEQVEGKK